MPFPTPAYLPARDARVPTVRRLALAISTMLAICGTTATSAKAQLPAVVPSSTAGVEGSTGTLIPFGLSQPARVQAIYGASEIPFARGQLLTRMRLRPDGTGAPIPAKAFVDIDLELSTTATRADAVSLTFDDNHGDDRTLVIGNQRFSLPAMPASNGPHGFAIDLPFDQPWVFGLTPVFGGSPPENLCVEIRVRNQASGAFRLDAPLSCTSNVQPFGAIGPSCLTSSGMPLTLTSNDSVLAGGNITYQIANAPANAIAAVALDFVPLQPALPLDDPSNPLPAYDCLLNLDFENVRVVVANASGAATIGLPLPGDLRLVGRPVFAQAACSDPSANPLGFVTSAGLATEICGPLPIARLYAIGDAFAATGQRNFGTAYVLEFQ